MNSELEIFKAKYLNEIKNIYINNLEISKLYDFLALELFTNFKIAQKEHNKFFWLLNDINKDFEHYKAEAEAWSIPVFSFETKEKAFERIIKGLNFIRFKGTNEQLNEIMNTIFEKGKWRYNTYSEESKISIDIIDYTEEKAKNALEYLEYAIPPYILLELIRYKLPDFDKRYYYDEIAENGGSVFINKYLNKFIKNAIMLPLEALSLDKSKLNTDLIKRIDKNGDKKTILLFKKDFETTEVLNYVVDSFFQRNDADIFIL